MEHAKSSKHTSTGVVLKSGEFHASLGLRPNEERLEFATEANISEQIRVTS